MGRDAEIAVGVTSQDGGKKTKQRIGNGIILTSEAATAMAFFAVCIAWNGRDAKIRCELFK